MCLGSVEISHIVPQALFFETLEPFVVLCREPRPFLRDGVHERSILLPLDAATLPLIGQFLAHLYCSSAVG